MPDPSVSSPHIEDDPVLQLIKSAIRGAQAPGDVNPAVTLNPRTERCPEM
jgi:hypothetical protein